MSDYTAQDLSTAIRACGATPGRVLFCHSNIGYFGRPEGVASLADLNAMVTRCLLEAVGQDGTLVVPTFSYSFGSDKPEKVFDPATTASVCGALSEHIRTLPEARRNLDPMFSVAAIGPQAEALTGDTGQECFGEDSFWRRFLDADGLVLNLNFDAGSTFLHFVERRLGVPYRSDLTMSGEIAVDGVHRAAECVYFARNLDDPDASPKFERFDALARAAGIVQTARVGRGSVVAISARDAAAFLAEAIQAEPRLMTASGQG